MCDVDGAVTERHSMPILVSCTLCRRPCAAMCVFSMGVDGGVCLQHAGLFCHLSGCIVGVDEWVPSPFTFFLFSFFCTFISCVVLVVSTSC